MSFQQGLSGLNSSAKQLDAIGNNVANASTIGFKQSQAQFADLYASSLSGSGTVQVGTGVKVASVVQQFTQGNVTNTANSMDTAINGKGFFRMIDQNGGVSYSRNGQFQLDKDGFIVNAMGHKVSGYLPDATGAIIAAQPLPIQISAADLTPQASANVNIGLNLDSRLPLPAQPVFSPADATSFNNSTSLTVYDSVGASHVATLYFQRQPDPVTPTIASNTWNVYMTVDGVQVTGAAPIGTELAQLTFDVTGALVSPAGPPLGVAPSNPLFPTSTTVDPAQALTFNFGQSSQYGGQFGVNSMTQDGFASGRLSGFNIASDGIILGRYTNGQSRPLGQVVMANFTNPQGLQPLGNNAWAETTASGQPLVGKPGSGSLGVLQSAAVEDSNVDLTAELVNMITAQRVYQANAQTIKAQDQILQTLVNLR